jgi:transposase
MSKTTNKFSPEVRERAVRMVLDNQGQHDSRWSAILFAPRSDVRGRR